MAFEIQVGRLAITLIAHQRLQHADHLGALVVDGGGVEVVDFDITGRLYRMGQRAGIFGELASTQGAHILDALHAMAAHVAAECLVAEDSEALLQRQLEPVAAGDAVAGPVVEIFVRHHAFDAGIVVVGGGFGRSQQHLVVEDVEALVLHRAHVEGADGHDHEDVEVIFAAIGLFVPFHGTLERPHRIGGARLVAMLDIDGELDLAARHGGEAVMDAAQIPRHQRKQIGGLGEGVVPHREMPSVRQLAMVGAVAVGEQHRILLLRRLDPHREDRKIVGPVNEVCDAAKAFRLALGAEHAARQKQAFQRGVGGRINLADDFQREAVGHARDGQALVVQQIPVAIKRPAVQRHRQQLLRFALQHQRPRAGLAHDFQGGDHTRRLRLQREIQMHGPDAEFGRLVIGQMDGAGFFSAHDRDSAGEGDL